MKFRFGITEKLIVSVVVLVGILTLGAGYYTFTYQKELLLLQFDERARTMIESLSQSSEYPVLTGNRELLKGLGSAVLGREDVYACEIKDKSGIVLFRAERSKKSSALRGYVASVTTQRRASSPDEMLLFEPQERKGEKIGEVYLAFSLDRLTRDMERQRNAIIWIMLVGILAIVVFVTILINFILGGPVNELVKGTRKIASGDLGYKVPVRTHDEIGLLSLSFNKMTEDLKRIIVSRDSLAVEISERKHAEEQLEAAYEKLKEAQSQLLQSAKMASIGQLASGVAHEINNPLTGVLNNVQLIKMEVDMKKEFRIEDFRELMDIIESSALRCKKITQALLDFSRSSATQLQDVSLNNVVESVLMLISHEMNLQNIEIHKSLEPGIPLVRGEPQLLEQVLFDLLVNAKWAVQKKSGGSNERIAIATRYNPVLEQVEVSVSDTGIGIPKENLDKVFEPFFTTKEVGEGTGLGLSLVYTIIVNHGGTIGVESQAGKGSSFTVKLPRGPEKENP